MADASPPPDLLVLPWLLGFSTLAPTDASADERGVLDQIDTVLANATLPDRLLPRAAHLIPQLIALLRQTDLPVAEITARIGKDAMLAAEVMRLSDSPYYRRQDPVRNLEEAVLWHGGEAEFSRETFLAMSIDDRRKLIAFLDSL